MGVDYARFSGGRGDCAGAMPFGGNFILCVGRLVEKKGMADLLGAVSLLAGDFPETGLVIIGRGPMETVLRERAAVLGIREKVIFTGRLGHPEICAYMHGCRAVAIPSIVDRAGETEGMPAVLAEALAAGCRVVATAVSGIPDILAHGANGWLAAPGHPADFAEKLGCALRHRGADLPERARKTAARLDWAEVARRYLAEFETAMKRRRPG
jgi:glycosyltransferase involved in cell wall biosynthesis